MSYAPDSIQLHTHTHNYTYTQGFANTYLHEIRTIAQPEDSFFYYVKINLRDQFKLKIQKISNDIL